MHLTHPPPTPPTPRPTPENGGIYTAWPVICDLQIQMHYLLRKLDELEARMNDVDTARTIWRPSIFLSQSSEMEAIASHGHAGGSAALTTASVDEGEWEAIVKCVIGDCT